MKKCFAPVISLWLVLCLTGCGSKETMIPELLNPVEVKIDVAKAEIGDIWRVSAYNGEVVPAVSELCFSVDGILEEIHVMVGDMVEKGQVLATLSEKHTIEQQKKLEDEIADILALGEFNDRQAAADIAAAKEELVILKDSGAPDKTCRVKELDIQILEQNLEQTVELRNLELQEKQESLKRMQKMAGNSEIVAPFNGRIVYVSEVKEGAAVPENTPVIYIADESCLSLSTDYISESIIANADKVFAKIMDKEYEISYVPYDSNELMKMHLSGVEIKSKFTVNTEDACLESGQFAAIMVYSAYREDVLTIPVNCLYRDTVGQYVYKQDGNGRVRCNVKVGMMTDTKAQILEGLKEGDLIYVRE